MPAKPSKGGKAKIGRQKIKCAAYRGSNRKEKNALRRLAAIIAGFRHPENYQAIVGEHGPRIARVAGAEKARRLSRIKKAA